jgi:hypothetical protein
LCELERENSGHGSHLESSQTDLFNLVDPLVDSVPLDQMNADQGETFLPTKYVVD